MPSSQSLNVTEAYRRGMVGLRHQVEQTAGTEWDRLDSNDLQGSYAVWKGKTTRAVAQAQRQGARLSAAYLTAFISSELGIRTQIVTPSLDGVGKTRDGRSLEETYDSPLIGVLSAIKDGQSVHDALEAGRIRALRTVGLDSDTAIRDSLAKLMEADDRVEGYRRAVAGTCPACAGQASNSILPPNTPLDIHPGCRCVAEPTVRAKDPHEVLNKRSMKESGEYPDEGIGPGGFTKRQVVAMEGYCATDFSYFVNGWLRRQLDEVLEKAAKVGRPRDKKQIVADSRLLAERMDDAFDATGPIGEPVEVLRGIQGSLEDLGITGDPVGQMFTDKAFGSTTSQMARAMWVETFGTRTIFTLRVDPRVRAIWGMNISEGEMVLERGCRYVITSIEKVRGTWRVKADVLPPV